MEAADVTEAVTDAKRTQLDRLGSQKSLLALTNARLEAETVLRRAGAAELAAHETFATWAETEDDDRARDAFESVAETEADHYERIATLLEERPEAAPDALHEHLRGVERTLDRVGAGLIGRPLVAERSTVQVISFFINEADERHADLFREFRSDTEAMRSDGQALLEALCTDEDDYERARSAAEDAIHVAYQEYADTLEGMGIDPRPVC